MWTEALPLVLLGLRATFKKDLNGSCTEFIFGQKLVLPGELVVLSPLPLIKELPNLVERERTHCANLNLPLLTPLPAHTCLAAWRLASFFSYVTTPSSPPPGTIH